VTRGPAVGPPPGPGKQAVLVAGVNGSAHGDAALGYALAEAARRGARLRVVIACRRPEMSDFSYTIYQVANPKQVRAAAAAAARRRIEKIRSRVREASFVEVEVLARSGSPVSVLVDAAQDADLLVVGHRGRGALRSTLLGSVGLGVVLNATCPVTVVPDPALPGAPRGANRPAHEAPPVPLAVGPVA
jgi:nucleotide-binding universal stress UspA family protein